MPDEYDTPPQYTCVEPPPRLADPHHRDLAMKLNRQAWKNMKNKRVPVRKRRKKKTDSRLTPKFY